MTKKVSSENEKGANTLHISGNNKNPLSTKNIYVGWVFENGIESTSDLALSSQPISSEMSLILKRGARGRKKDFLNFKNTQLSVLSFQTETNFGRKFIQQAVYTNL